MHGSCYTVPPVCGHTPSCVTMAAFHWWCYVWNVGAVPAIKHEWPASPACSLVDLCSSDSDLDDVQQPPLLLEDSSKPAVATAQPAGAAKRQEPSAAEQVRTPALPARQSPAPTARAANQPPKQANQAAHGVPAHRQCRASSQDHASRPDAQTPVRVPLHGPRLPDRPQKRKCSNTEAGPGPSTGFMCSQEAQRSYQQTQKQWACGLGRNACADKSE